MSAPSSKVPHDHVHEQLDPHFFLDYALFSGALRHYATKSLEDAFRADPNDVHRRFFVLGVFREEHAAYEDLGAILESLIRLKLQELAYPIEGVLRFKDDLVVLETLFRRRGIKSDDQLFEGLGLQAFVPPAWGAIYPKIDCERALRRMCSFFYQDCQRNQRRQGVSAYNKIKHGLVLVPNARRYDISLPDAPGALIQNPIAGSPNPYALLAIPMDDSSLEERCRVVEFTQYSLRAIAALYAITRYPEHVKTRIGAVEAVSIFDTAPLLEVKSFMDQLSNKPLESHAAP